MAFKWRVYGPWVAYISTSFAATLMPGHGHKTNPLATTFLSLPA